MIFVHMVQETHFGFKQVSAPEKAQKVAEVFDSVADKYDVMNDLMSAGMHRLWKQFAITVAGIRPHENALDVASGTGDLALSLAKNLTSGGGKASQITLTDINASMLAIGKARLQDAGYLVQSTIADCEALPFPAEQFHLATLAFGLRNMTHKDRALAEIYRVLKPGGRLLILEFSKIWQPLQKAYDAFSFNVIPTLGECVTGDRESYQYLVESIRMHPDQATLQTLMESAGFERVTYWNLALGAVALHRGYKPY
jgi:demethylmenaquinone methyltransferase/2-methoxy-6-polyprenyl-1,4-benzoquinol methylase